MFSPEGLFAQIHPRLERNVLYIEQKVVPSWSLLRAPSDQSIDSDCVLPRYASAGSKGTATGTGFVLDGRDCNTTCSKACRTAG